MDFYINKTSGTLSDTLLAIGFACCLDDLYSSQYKDQGEVYLYNEGYRHRVNCPKPLDVQQISDDFLETFQIVLPLDSERQREKLLKKGQQSLHIDGFPYDVEMSKLQRSQKQQAVGKSSQEEMNLENISNKVREQFGHYQTIVEMIIADSFNNLSLRWCELSPQQKRLYIQFLLSLFQQADNNIEEFIKRWKDQNIDIDSKVEPLQLINPTEGKGSNRAKSGKLNINKHDKFWLLELLKWRGYMEASVPLIVKENKTASKEKSDDKRDKPDRKVYVVQPQHIKISLLRDIMKDFRGVLWPTTAIKLDILASLRFAKVVINQHHAHFKSEGRLPSWFPRELSSIATELDVCFYKYLNRAYVNMNLSTIGLPTWLPEPNSSAAVASVTALLDEHIRIIRDLHNSKGEEGGEEYTLLRAYRDFLSGRTLQPSFWQFTTSYAGYLMSQREHEKNPKLHLRQLSVKGLDYLIMHSTTEKQRLSIITGDEGFRRIAYAIRQSTVKAQRRRSQEQDRTYEVRYGLAQELMREVRYREKFIAALSNFLTLYNAETAREEEKLANRLGRQLTLEDRYQHKLRASVSISDLDRVISLIDQFDSSELVGSLLVAYGYASEARRDHGTPEEAADTDDTGTPDSTDANGSSNETNE